MSAFAPQSSQAVLKPRSLRRQVMAAVIAINLCAALAAMVVVIANARRATETEILSSLAVAVRFVEETALRLADAPDSTGSLAQLPLHINGLRHVRIRIEDAQGNGVDVAPPTRDVEDDEKEEVPGWFTALISVPPAERDVSVFENGALVGHVRVTGEASDEIAEVWEDMSSLAWLAIVVNVAILAALYLALGRLLKPLNTLSAGLQELEEGHFEHRLPPPSVSELAVIADRFNALGLALRRARDDNSRLNERLIQVQDDERRQIASDLHDELGPCLFGLRANLESLARLSARTETDLAGRMAERVETMVEILDRIQGLNRQLLRRIRPMALGHVPLSAVIADLVADFRGHAPDRTFRLVSTGLADRYGDSIDITVFRCLQEAVTNALRHGDAMQIGITLRHDSREGLLELVVEDDGTGMRADTSPGFGLIGIEERIGALGGCWRIVPGEPHGTRIEITIPLHPAMHNIVTAETTVSQ
ncbi:ATP-binding protein [Ancylobacter pratisalsi]|uniref:HAMP domain-containing protein n=1 Tax=Ancylobacter pratisalsi TaxID=1745854 RepID=A0A6P1YQL3_9HYPH|nr:ATP-binding protein [Ancylobacter pratisalsi]QIB35757.1 HAMP domain-containing protein [Ancylobacter pratisalsi]